MPPQRRRARCIKEIARVKYIVAVELISTAMQTVGAGLEEDVHDAARRFPVFGALIRRQNFEFFNGFDAQYQTARQVERRHTIRERHIHTFLQITIINRP